MRVLLLFLVLTLSCCHGLSLLAQTPVLPEPSLQSVEVTADAAVVLRWHYESSVAADGFIIERWQYISDTISSSINESSWKVVDTVASTQREYHDNGAHADVKKRIYRVKAFVYYGGAVFEGPPSNQMLTLWLSPTMVFDSCNMSIRMRWTGYFEGVDIFYRLNVNGQDIDLEPRAVVDSVPTYETAQGDFYTNVYEYVLMVSPSTLYSLYVAMELPDGKSSTSNVVTVSSGTYTEPQLPNIIYVSVREDNIVEMLLRDIAINEVDSILVSRNGSICHCSKPIDSVVLVFDDSGAAQYSSVSYVASVLDYCGKAYESEGEVSTIFLEGGADESSVSLSWDADTQPWEAVEFNIWRRLPEEADFSCIGTSMTASFVDILGDGVLPAYYLYRVEQRGADGLSVFSNICKVTFESLDVLMPNAFIPSGVTPTFGPIFKAPPHSDYKFMVLNREGLVLFQTKEYTSRWDGTYAGQPVNAGAYLWQVSFRTSQGRYIFKQGSVIVLN